MYVRTLRYISFRFKSDSILNFGIVNSVIMGSMLFIAYSNIPGDSFNWFNKSGKPVRDVGKTITNSAEFPLYGIFIIYEVLVVILETSDHSD